jgi:phage shock protein PspC (stress-responsive transcriptional regulator)
MVPPRPSASTRVASGLIPDVTGSPEQHPGAMTTYQPPPAPVPSPPSSAPPLTRRESNKVVAGVCSGVAHRLGIDPNVVRIVTIVLAIFGGVGILLYAVGWLLLPEERTGRSLAERALRGGEPDRASAVLLALALTLVAVGFGFAVVGDNWFGVAVLAVALGIGALLFTRVPDAPYPTGPVAGPAGAPGPATGTPVAPGWYPRAPETAPVDTTAATAFSSEPAPPRPRSVLGPATVFAALAALGVLGLVDAAGAQVPVSAYLALPLAVVGAGLVLGAWVGRSRGLIALGVGLSVLLAPVLTLEQLGVATTAGQRYEAVVLEPATADELDETVWEYGAGDIRWDLTGTDFADSEVETQISVGAGELVVDLPPDLTLVLDASVGAGQIDALGTMSSGLAAEASRTFAGDEGGGTLRLTVSMGLGNVEVNREQA